jgi:hypothetical protein
MIHAQAAVYAELKSLTTVVLQNVINDNRRAKRGKRQPQNSKGVVIQRIYD